MSAPVSAAERLERILAPQQNNGFVSTVSNQHISKNNENPSNGLKRASNWPSLWDEDQKPHECGDILSPVTAALSFPSHAHMTANPTYNWLPPVNFHRFHQYNSSNKHKVLGLNRSSPLPMKEDNDSGDSHRSNGIMTNDDHHSPPGTSSINTAEDGPTPTRSTATDLNRLLSRNHTNRMTSPFVNGSPITAEQVYAGLGSLSAIGIGSAFLAALCVQTLLGLHERALLFSAAASRLMPGTSGDDLDMLIPPPRSTRYVLCDVASTLCMIALSFSISALFTAAFQLFLSLKVLKMSADSHMQIMRYMREGLFLRFVAFFGFFISIPLYLLAILALMLSTSGSVGGSAVPIGIFVVASLLAFTICVSVMGHGAYAWLVGSLKFPPTDSDERNGKRPKNLSTLV